MKIIVLLHCDYESRRVIVSGILPPMLIVFELATIRNREELRNTEIDIDGSKYNLEKLVYSRCSEDHLENLAWFFHDTEEAQR